VIGRTPDCDIRINDKLLSKNQACITFLPDQTSWWLIDGFNNKKSTNGTWLYLNEDFKMHNGMIFKANQTIFSVELKETSKLSAR
jgi:predicted component of type VI protein secretion system